MANLSKKELDARSFPEIWKELTPVQQIELRNEIISKLHVTRQAVHHWAIGKRKPTLDIVKKEVCKSLANVSGIHAYYLSLFI